MIGSAIGHKGLITVQLGYKTNITYMQQAEQCDSYHVHTDLLSPWLI